MKDRKIIKSFEKIKLNDGTKERILTSVLNDVKTEKNSNSKHSIRKEFFMKKSVIAAVIAICIVAMSGGVYAHYKWLNAKQTVLEMGYEKLSKYFDIDKDDIQIEEMGKYRAIFLGIVSGANINDKILDEDIDKSLSYIVTAVEHKDGTNMTYDDDIVVSPFISGIRPIDFSIYSIHGGAKMMLKDGTLYTLTECDDLEIFADRNVYLAVMNGVNMGDGYNYDEKSGDITRNKKAKKLNLLFQVNLDKSKADPEAAQKYIDKMLDNTPSQKDLTEDDLAAMKTDAEQKVKNGVGITGERAKLFLEKCEYEETEIMLKPDKNGVLSDDSGHCWLADDVKENHLVIERYSSSHNKLSESIDEIVYVWTYENGQYFERIYRYFHEDYEGHNDLTEPEKVISQAKLVKGSEQKLTSDKTGTLHYVNDEIDLSTSSKAVKKNGIDTLLLYGENNNDEILVFTYESGEYFGRVYTCSQSITRKAERKK